MMEGTRLLNSPIALTMLYNNILHNEGLIRNTLSSNLWPALPCFHFFASIKSFVYHGVGVSDGFSSNYSELIWSNIWLLP